MKINIYFFQVSWLRTFFSLHYPYHHVYQISRKIKKSTRLIFFISFFYFYRFAHFYSTCKNLREKLKKEYNFFNDEDVGLVRLNERTSSTNQRAHGCNFMQSNLLIYSQLLSFSHENVSSSSFKLLKNSCAHSSYKKIFVYS